MVLGRWLLVLGLLVVRRWPSVFGRWSVVLGRWSLVVGLWSLVFVFHIHIGWGGMAIEPEKHGNADLHDESKAKRGVSKKNMLLFKNAKFEHALSV